MKYLQISTVMSYSSVGRIMRQNYNEKKALGWDCLIAYGRGNDMEGYNTVKIGSKLDQCIHGLSTRLLDRHGLASKIVTKKFIKEMDKYNPDIIHLHNIHGYYINYEILFKWIKQHPERKIMWTLHDCWSMTGHCAYFTAVGCDKWKTQCNKCEQLYRYPKSNCLDKSRRNFERKKKAFTRVENLTLIVPSYWLKNIVKQSFLKDYPIEVIYNKIDKTVFKPTQSDFRKRYDLQDKKIILGVANVWEERKGLNDFIELAKMLDDRYAIVLVGLTPKQIKHMPKQIKGLVRTISAKELAAVYSAADVFVNPSVEETFGMTTVEAQACGTKTIVYKETACEEIIKGTDGIAIPVGVENIYKAIMENEN